MSAEGETAPCEHPAGHVVVGAGGRASCRDCGHGVALVIGSTAWIADEDGARRL